jgi:hypothetical protein
MHEGECALEWECPHVAALARRKQQARRNPMRILRPIKAPPPQYKPTRGRQHVLDKDEDGLLRRELDALADDVDKLADGEVGRHQVLLLVDVGDVGLFGALDDDLGVGYGGVSGGNGRRMGQ